MIIQISSFQPDFFFFSKSEDQGSISQTFLEQCVCVNAHFVENILQLVIPLCKTNFAFFFWRGVQILGSWERNNLIPSPIYMGCCLILSRCITIEEEHQKINMMFLTPHISPQQEFLNPKRHGFPLNDHFQSTWIDNEKFRNANSNSVLIALYIPIDIVYYAGLVW